MLTKKTEKKSLNRMRESFSSVQKAGSIAGSLSSFPSIKVKSPSLASSSKKKTVKQDPRPVSSVMKLELEAGCVSQEGPYHDNEDRMAYGTNLNQQVDCYVGVFDGHGGGDCATFVSTNLSDYLAETFETEGDWAKGEEKMNAMFHEIEDEYVEKAMEEDETSGACATVVIVKGMDAIVANIGDCKAVAVPDVSDPMASFVVLTGDHRADAPEEEDRIEKAGGNVVEGRVGNLQPSRSFGDIDVKEIVGAGVVIPTPEVSRVRCKVGGFMIIATDGLWDYIDTETAVEVAKDVLENSDYNSELAAEELVDMAVKRRALDDVTVAVVVWKPSSEEGASSPPVAVSSVQEVKGNLEDVI